MDQRRRDRLIRRPRDRQPERRAYMPQEPPLFELQVAKPMAPQSTVSILPLSQKVSDLPAHVASLVYGSQSSPARHAYPPPESLGKQPSLYWPQSSRPTWPSRQCKSTLPSHPMVSSAPPGGAVQAAPLPRQCATVVEPGGMQDAARRPQSRSFSVPPP